MGTKNLLGVFCSISFYLIDEMDQSVCSSNVWRADESSTNRSDLHKQPFYFLSKIREKHQVYSHILKVDESPHFYSGTPLKYAHMIQSKLFFFFVLAVCSAPQFILCLKQQAIAYVPLRQPI